MDFDTLERLVPEHLRSGEITGQQTLELHLARYKFAASHSRPGRLLDIACGVGYGTLLLIERADLITEAIGVDLSQEAINYAREKYTRGNISFVVKEAMQFFDPEGFDTIVSLETIEHLPDPNRFIGHVVHQLRPGGIFVGSVPTTPSTDANPFHLHDFTERSFRHLVNSYGLQEIACLRQIQPFNPITVLTRSESRLRVLRRNLVNYYIHHPQALARRIWSTLRYGLTMRYITIAWSHETQESGSMG